MVKEAIILAGGKGIRLKPLTDVVPKSLIMINNKPLVDYQVEWLKNNGYEKIILACGYRADLLKKSLGSSVTYSVEDSPLGTAGAVRRAMKYVQRKDFLVMNGDIITDLSLKELEKIHKRLSMVLVPMRSPFGIVSEKKGKIVFEEKPKLPYWINAGIYLINRSVELPVEGDLEKDVFPREEIKVYRYEGFWRSIDTFKDIAEVEKEI